MNKTIENLINHSSVRNFKDQELSNTQKEQLITAAQSAASSNFLQAYTILEITDLEKRKKIADLTNCQDYILKTGAFFIFVADLYRHEANLSKNNQEVTPLASSDSLLVSIIDTALAAQNMVVAAESMGLGTCYIGGIRNDLFEVKNLLELPPLTVPLFGLTIGVPESTNAVKPRMPLSNVYAENTYQKSKNTDMSEYDSLLDNYYKSRSSNAQIANWSTKSLDYFAFNRRPLVKKFLESQGFDI